MKVIISNQETSSLLLVSVHIINDFYQLRTILQQQLRRIN